MEIDETSVIFGCFLEGKDFFMHLNLEPPAATMILEATIAYYIVNDPEFHSLLVRAMTQARANPQFYKKKR